MRPEAARPDATAGRRSRVLRLLASLVAEIANTDAEARAAASVFNFLYRAILLALLVQKYKY
jgi:hypothetical protein